jgi:hypothetical protein
MPSILISEEGFIARVFSATLIVFCYPLRGGLPQLAPNQVLA